MPSDFFASWSLSRKRFNDAISPLNEAQLNFRLHPGTLTAGEMALHVAGVERFFISQLLGQPPHGLDARIAKTATEGVVNDNPFPFQPAEITPELVASALAAAADETRPVIEDPSQAVLQRRIISALGPEIDGAGALARLAFHPGYHQGQVQFIVTAPAFPA